jgi:hypothetical protein
VSARVHDGTATATVARSRLTAWLTPAGIQTARPADTGYSSSRVRAVSAPVLTHRRIGWLLVCQSTWPAEVSAAVYGKSYGTPAPHKYK